jgi:outer membrane lipoprotein SlyB
VVAVGSVTGSLVGAAVVGAVPPVVGATSGTSVASAGAVGGVVAVGDRVAVAELPQAMMNKTTNAENRINIDFFIEISSL